MVRTAYSYPATLEPDEEGRLVVRFPALPEALTDGADEVEALREAAGCLSEALASRIVDGEEIPAPAPMAAGQHLVSPDPTIALKAALYMALRQRDLTVADLAARLEMDWHQAARLIDPKRASKLTSLAAALGALGCHIAISIEDPDAPGDKLFGAWSALVASAALQGANADLEDWQRKPFAARAFRTFLVAIERFQTLDDVHATKEAKEAKEAARQLQTVLRELAEQPHVH